jgi:hypothetical protein
MTANEYPWRGIAACGFAATAALFLAVLATDRGQKNDTSIGVVAHSAGIRLDALEMRLDSIDRELGALADSHAIDVAPHVVETRKALRDLTSELRERFEDVRLRLDRVDSQTVYRWRRLPEPPPEVSW